MTEEQMQKFLDESLEKEDLSQLRFPFNLDQAEDNDPSLPYLISDGENDSKPLFQKDFLTHKVNQTIDQ